jgi:hypothetical protein
MCDNDPDALRLLREVVTGERGQSKGNDDNITVFEEREAGTSKDYTLDRLARERPDLYEDVVQDRKSANGAFVLTVQIGLTPAHHGGEHAGGILPIAAATERPEVFLVIPAWMFLIIPVGCRWGFVLLPGGFDLKPFR